MVLNLFASHASRIYHWLVSSVVLECISEVPMSATPLTDYVIISLHLMGFAIMATGSFLIQHLLNYQDTDGLTANFYKDFWEKLRLVEILTDDILQIPLMKHGVNHLDSQTWKRSPRSPIHPPVDRCLHKSP